jgi:hypothetical protein
MCCGRDTRRTNNVSPVRPTTAPARPSASRSPRTAARPAAASAYFEYVGATGMTVQGPVSGRRYRFEGPGSRLAVDPRDRPSMAAIPNLRQVAGG